MLASCFKLFLLISLQTVSYRSFLTSTYPFGWNEGPPSRGVGPPLSIQVDPGATSLGIMLVAMSAEKVQIYFD